METIWQSNDFMNIWNGPENNLKVQDDRGGETMKMVNLKPSFGEWNERGLWDDEP